MSKYEDYDLISANYDKTRTAVGLDIVIGYIYTMSKSNENLHILDAGCGTGNYSLELNKYFPNIWCADFSMGMLNKCKEKFSDENKSVNFLRCDISKLPFKDETLDVIICNQSLHHLDDPETNFKNLSLFLNHSARCLTSGGLMLINTITHDQLENGVWWGDLIKPAVDRMKKRFTTDEQLFSLLDNAGLVVTNRVVDLDVIIQQNRYFDEDSLFDKDFRDGDSHFSLLTESELNSILNEIQEMKNNGTLSKYIKERDKLRKKIGQFTYYVIKKK